MARKAGSSAEDAFLQAILDQPDNDIPRLVFADWLEEQGNPRGTFIRLQCQRAQITRHNPGWSDMLAQESALRKRFDDEWSKPVLRLVDAIEYRRGFIEHVRLSANRLLRSADRLFRIAPVSSIRLDHVDRLSEIAAAPWLARVRELDMSQNTLGHRSLQTLVQSEHCRSLRVLRLNECVLGLTALQVLAREPNLQNLTSLSLASNGIDSAGASVLAESVSLAHLQELNLHQNNLEAAGAMALAASPTFRLTRLSLGLNRILNDGAAAIARSAQFEELRYLDLQSNSLGNPAVAALCESPYLHKLEHLNLYHNIINRIGVQMLTESPLLGNLSYLNVASNEIDRATMLTVPQRLKTDRMRDLVC